MSQCKTVLVVAFSLVLLAFYNEIINNIDSEYINFYNYSF